MNASQYQVTTHDQVAPISNFNQQPPQHHQMATFNGHSHNYNVQRTADQYSGYHQLPHYSTANPHDYQSQQSMVGSTSGDVYSNVCNRFRKLHEHSQQQWQRYSSTYDQMVAQSNQEFTVLHQRLNNGNANTSVSASKAKSKAVSNGRTKQYQRVQASKTPQTARPPSPSQVIQLPPQKQLQALQTQIQPAPQPPLPQQHPQQSQQRLQQQSQARQYNYPNEVPYLDVNSLPPIQSNVQVIKQEEINFGTITGTGILDGLYNNDIFADAEFTGELLGEINGQQWPPADITSVFLNYAENCKMF